MIRAAIFDFDMTLIDSSSGVTFCLNRLAEVFGLASVTRGEILKTIGYPMEEAMGMLWSSFEPSWLEYYRDNLVALEYERLVAFPGVVSSLRRLQKSGIAMAVVSNRKRILPAVRSVELEGFFPHLVGMEDVTFPKPHPQPIFIALEKLHESPERTVFAGDSEVDARAAKAAGVRFIGLTTGGRSRADLLSEGAYEVVDDFSKIVPLILADRRGHGFSDAGGEL